MRKAKDFYLNECSLTKVEDKAKAHEVISTFIRTASALQKYGFGALRYDTDVNLKSVEITDDYFIYQWLSDEQVDIEERRRFKGISTQAPMIDKENKLLHQQTQISDAYYEGLRAIGITAAYNDESFVVSFCTKDYWDQSILSVKLNTVENEKFAENEVSIKNFATLENCLYHIAWIKSEIELPIVKHNNPLHFAIISSLYLKNQGKKPEKVSQQEKIAYYKETSKQIAALNFFEYNSSLSNCNNRSIFEFGEGKSKVYLGLDTENGTFECHDYSGKHQGEYNFDGIFTKNSSHVLKFC